MRRFVLDRASVQSAFGGVVGRFDLRTLHKEQDAPAVMPQPDAVGQPLIVLVPVLPVTQLAVNLLPDQPPTFPVWLRNAFSGRWSRHSCVASRRVALNSRVKAFGRLVFGSSTGLGF
ncbi:MAG: hypothetical protein JWM59_1126 [Verrucomicrobiales bacterium]|nr:hypothetical protein [Verrucomicrobiales bacterium]